MVQVRQEAGATVVLLGREYDALDETHMQDAADALLEAVSQSAPTPRVVLDFSNTEYIGSKFIELLFLVADRVRGRQGKLAVCGLNSFCAEVLKVSALDRHFPTFPDLSAALRSLAAS